MLNLGPLMLIAFPGLIFSLREQPNVVLRTGDSTPSVDLRQVREERSKNGDEPYRPVLDGCGVHGAGGSGILGFTAIIQNWAISLTPAEQRPILSVHPPAGAHSITSAWDGRGLSPGPRTSPLPQTAIPNSKPNIYQELSIAIALLSL